LEIGSYKPGDIEVVAAFDTDKRKVGVDVHEAIFAAPNCMTIFCSDIPKSGVTVRMGQILDGFSDHMTHYDQRRTFSLADETESTEEHID
jgi:myo-inositol-1-phosphate synthase